MTSVSELERHALSVRRHIVEIAGVTGCHVGGCLSAVDILTALYLGVMNLPPEAGPEEVDHFILSAGHKAAAYYSVLAEKGCLDAGELAGYEARGGILAGHPTKAVPGVEVATGSLGHGLPIGAGMAYAARYDGKHSRVFVLMGDGETQEGSVWEAAMAAAHLGLDNLVAVIDRNGLQIQGRTEDIVRLEPIALRWQAFGWAVREVDGHDMSALCGALGATPFERGKPSLVIARTVKGKGVPFIENQVKWHYGRFSREQRDEALSVLAGGGPR